MGQDPVNMKILAPQIGVFYRVAPQKQNSDFLENNLKDIDSFSIIYVDYFPNWSYKGGTPSIWANILSTWCNWNGRTLRYGWKNTA
jgi:hypothetical protein